MMNPHIFQINSSTGGVPKLAQPSAEVSIIGLTNDVQRNKKHHGGPDRALCLFSLELILALQAEGHPIYPGAIGENVTIAGLDWDKIVPGVCLELGTQVLIEITSYAVPCKNIQGAFHKKKMKRVSQKVYPGWARAYVRVLQTGTIKIGDKIQLVPADV
ncbi:MAG: MOSC domain-containing protein [Chloroflexi bacterium]|nr:MOSC domain-containing protein [Chloroflexota bacterium]